MYVAGYGTSLHGAQLSNDFVTLAYDVAGGQRRWASRYTGELYMNYVPALEIAPDGTAVYVVGNSRLDFTLAGARTAVLAYDADDGAQLWTGRHTDGQTFPSAIALSPDGRRLYSAGSTADPGAPGAGYDAFITAYATTSQ